MTNMVDAGQGLADSLGSTQVASNTTGPVTLGLVMGRLGADTLCRRQPSASISERLFPSALFPVFQSSP